MYQALYRKWRPKTFSDVVGQEHVTETLQRQVAEGRLSHAYLFTGTRGTGKTTCAKILAKAVNCEHPENGNPCNKCSSCLGIESGGFLDVMELDAASNNGVDHVRALRDEAIYSPAQVKKRVYIIDEVHMLSIAAFNALLKILEEPPEHLMFILATTELHKVPATILSRCQRFAFRRILPREIVGRLNYIAEQEGIDLRPDGAELLAHIADGALRDALSLLDQCAAAGGTIDSAAVLDALGLAGNLQTAQLMDCVLRRDTKAALLLLHRLYGSGKDVGAVLGELRRRDDQKALAGAQILRIDHKDVLVLLRRGAGILIAAGEIRADGDLHHRVILVRVAREHLAVLVLADRRRAAKVSAAVHVGKNVGGRDVHTIVEVLAVLDDAQRRDGNIIALEQRGRQVARAVGNNLHSHRSFLPS